MQHVVNGRDRNLHAARCKREGQEPACSTLKTASRGPSHLRIRLSSLQCPFTADTHNIKKVVPHLRSVL